jgi:hypothetical protein
LEIIRWEMLSAHCRANSKEILTIQRIWGLYKCIGKSKDKGKGKGKGKSRIKL